MADSAAGATFDPSIETLDQLLSAATGGRIGKEGVPAVLTALAGGAASVDAAISSTGLEGFLSADLREIVGRVVRAHAGMVRTRGSDAFSPLMGDVMREVRGRRDGQEVAAELRKAIATELQRTGT